MLMKIAVVLVVVILLVLGIGMVLPRQCHVERTAMIEAPPANLYALLEGHALFNRWSPWYALEPDAEYARSGPATGVGSRLVWKGKKVGEGSQEIVEAKPYETVAIKLEFAGQGPATGRFVLAPEGAGTRVTWSLDSDMGAGPIGRYFGLFMDKMVGPDFEKGLAGLKSLAESMPKTDVAGLDLKPIEAKPIPVAYVETSSSQDLKEIAGAIGGAYMKVGAFMKERTLQQAGAPMTINTKWGDGVYVFDAAIPVDRMPEGDVPAASPVRVKTTYAGPALQVVHKGAYAGMPQTYEKLQAYMALHGLEAAGSPWDEYVSDPGATPEAELITNIVQPVK